MKLFRSNNKNKGEDVFGDHTQQCFELFSDQYSSGAWETQGYQGSNQELLNAKCMLQTLWAISQIQRKEYLKQP